MTFQRVYDLSPNQYVGIDGCECIVAERVGWMKILPGDGGCATEILSACRSLRTILIW